ncbi:uncharacterized protein [Elaeis guineensis]|uniref:Regulatory protein RecX n=1 Tax=Elaeis guineensis var. tenera TaxID=51953 RepID=A0A6J0PC64_ELAGV|nr:uncharacterized protein LOC105060507 isoform X2 [Elaeis guineensis]
MAIVAANRGVQMFLNLHPRCLVISLWAKKGCHSSGPVRYVPRDYTQSKKAQKSPRLGRYEKKETNLLKATASEGGKGAPKTPNFDDNGFHDSLFNAGPKFSEFEDSNDTVLEFVDTDVRDESELLLDEASNSCEIKGTKYDEVVSSKTRQDAEQLAIELLAARAFTTLELQKKLRGRKYALDIVDSVIAEIKGRGLLNDGLYAESFSQSRWFSSTWGPRRIKQALLKKGISEVEADKATKQVFEDDDSSGGSHNMRHGMSKTSMDRLFLLASKQWLRGQSTSLENRKARIIRWLQYRGFSWGVTSTILKRLESQYPMRE